MNKAGLAVEKDSDRAFYWYKKAALRKYVPVYSELAEMYARGLGVEQDYKQAYLWMGKAADSDNGK